MFLHPVPGCELRDVVPLAVSLAILAAFNSSLPTVQANARCCFPLVAAFRCLAVLPIVVVAMYLRPGASRLSTENADRPGAGCRLRLCWWLLFAGVILPDVWHGAQTREDSGRLPPVVGNFYHRTVEQFFGP